MARKEITFYGKNEKEMKVIKLEDFLKLAKSRVRRVFKRGLKEGQKDLLDKIRLFKEGKRKKLVKTHLRNMIIVPEMLGQIIHVYNGKEFKSVEVTVEKLGRYLGEFALTRSRVTHSSPGVGATKSSAAAKKK